MPARGSHQTGLEGPVRFRPSRCTSRTPTTDMLDTLLLLVRVSSAKVPSRSKSCASSIPRQHRHRAPNFPIHEAYGP